MKSKKFWNAGLLAGLLSTSGFCKADAQIFYVHSDHLGAPQALTNQSGMVVWEVSHAPFGEATASGSVEQPYRFPGQYADPEAGFSYNYFRSYDPSVGRYLQSDPIGLAGGWNTYAYVGGNPLRFADPLGLDFGFFVNPELADGNGHTTLYYQDGSSQWYSYDQGATGVSTDLDLGVLDYSYAPSGVTILPVSEVPAGAKLYKSTRLQDVGIAKSALNSQKAHNSGEDRYNILSNNCTDAAVDVVNSSGPGFNVPNPVFSPSPNSWFKGL